MKSDMMKYKGYRATVSYSEEDRVLVGEVFGINDALSFHGKSIKELEKSFHNCIDEYLEMCENIGKKPEKEYTGSFNVRMAPRLHMEASKYAAENRLSLNQVVSMSIESFLKKNVV